MTTQRKKEKRKKKNKETLKPMQSCGCSIDGLVEYYSDHYPWLSKFSSCTYHSHRLHCYPDHPWQIEHEAKGLEYSLIESASCLISHSVKSCSNKLMLEEAHRVFELLGDTRAIPVSPAAINWGTSLASPFGSSTMYHYEFWFYPKH